MNEPDDEVHAPPASSTELEVDAIFADIEDDPELSYKPLAPSLDLDALRREADARHAKAIVPMSFTSTDIPSGSSTIPSTNVQSRTDGRAKDQGEEGKKERRKVFKLDEARLLGPHGFPQLIKDTKNFKAKGKGHEVHLSRPHLLRSYL
jgi:replication fork protection complex subunit Csm3/Swi3